MLKKYNKKFVWWKDKTVIEIENRIENLTERKTN